MDEKRSIYGMAPWRPSRRAFMAGAATVAAATAARSARADAGQLTLRTPAGRAIDVRTWIVPQERGRVLFSHGALSAPWKYQSVIEAWGRAGYSVFAPLHVDSTDHPDHAAFPGLASWPARIEDVRALADHLGGPYVAAGHSYGGLIALVLGGASPAVPNGVPLPLRDPRAKVSVAFSPPGIDGTLVKTGDYATLAVPAFIQTGDHDTPPGPAADWRSHLAAYDEAKEGGDRYAAVLAGVDHYFGGAICRPELPAPHQDEALAAAVSLSILFMRAHFSGDMGALQVLRSRLAADGPVQLRHK
ncbi:alpha/beta fold hydrolase [Azospirillum sp. B4]|uniref:alpha/beta hydrolase family protein n=1 Tax=Azospirillum sp. B4 TaxID=95605 RepID=UPI000346EC5D|nr:alpha/beta fold hydrolase [Azospirillum sp. B4]